MKLTFLFGRTFWLTAPGAHILRLYKEREEAVRDQAELRGRLASIQDQHQVDVETALANLRQELQNRASDDAEMATRERTYACLFLKLSSILANMLSLCQQCESTPCYN